MSINVDSHKVELRNYSKSTPAEETVMLSVLLNPHEDRLDLAQINFPSRHLSISCHACQLEQPKEDTFPSTHISHLHPISYFQK